jgi:hypothetical protein
MTTELIVMNKNGLALAADSAITVSIGGRATKVYNTANKVFALSKYRPIGVMVYGSAEIMGLPWEIVIKYYREKLADRSFASFDEYVKDFFAYLEKMAFSETFYISYVRQRSAELFAFVMNEVDTLIRNRFAEKGAIEEAEVADLHKDVIEEWWSTIERLQEDLQIAPEDIAESVKNYRCTVKEVISKNLESRPVKDSVIDMLIETCLLAAIISPGINRSGLVIAGFGDTDVFPSAKAFEIHKILDGKADFHQEWDAAVSLDNTAYIKAFAQANETQNFMHGMSGKIEGYLSDELKKVLCGAFVDNVAELLAKDGIVAAEKLEQCKKSLREAGAGVHAYTLDRIYGIATHEFSNPVFSAVTFFSPCEMATMAETLVSLESFRQKVTLRSETVGGPIDVCVITRGDGFIWIKRKHYFSADLNHQYFRNYNKNLESNNADQES